MAILATVIFMNAMKRVGLLCALVLAPGCFWRHKAKPVAPAVVSIPAALPYQILDVRTGRIVPDDEFWTRLANVKAICVGEDHTNVHDHWAQMKVVSALAPKLAPGTVLGLGMEMFQRPFQGVLDDFVSRRIDEPTMLTHSDWQQRWPFDYGMYRPVASAAVSHGGVIVALNTQSELVKVIMEKGLEGLTDEQKKLLPDPFDLKDARHRAWWDKLVADQKAAAPAPAPAAVTPVTAPVAPPADGSAAPAAPEAVDEATLADRNYVVEVLGDETMSETTARWLKNAKEDSPRIAVIIAGSEHCNDLGVVGRLHKRGVTSAVSIQPVIDIGDRAVAQQLVAPSNDYLMVMTYPKGLSPSADKANKPTAAPAKK